MMQGVMDYDLDGSLLEDHQMWTPNADPMLSEVRHEDFDLNLNFDLDNIDAPLFDAAGRSPEAFLDKLLGEIDTMDSDHDHDYFGTMSSSSPGSSDRLSSASSSSPSALSDGYGQLDILRAASESSGIYDNYEPAYEQQQHHHKAPALQTQYQQYARPTQQQQRRTVPVHTPKGLPTARPAGGYVRFKPASARAIAPSSISLSSSSTTSSSSASLAPTARTGDRARKYAAIVLTDEEKRLCKKENINLPSHHPLTKAEERDLKRIRRKIRNKRSAQTSRKRKQDYIEQLEDRVNDSTHENLALKAEIETLQRQNASIMSQMRKMQALIAQSTKRHTQAGTCLAVLVLSVALLVAPSMSPLLKKAIAPAEADEAQTEDARGELPRPNIMPGRSRTLMEYSAVAPASVVQGGTCKRALPAAPAPPSHHDYAVNDQYGTDDTDDDLSKYLLPPTAKRARVAAWADRGRYVSAPYQVHGAAAFNNKIVVKEEYYVVPDHAASTGHYYTAGGELKLSPTHTTSSAASEPASPNYGETYGTQTSPVNHTHKQQAIYRTHFKTEPI